MTIQVLLNLAAKKLSKSSPSPALDSEVLLSLVLKKSKEYLYIYSGKQATKSQEKKFLKLITLRSNGWPVAYLTNTKEFYGLDFYVDKNVLIPRPETEGLVEHVLRHVPRHAPSTSLKILDIGTGSGAIIISLAKNRIWGTGYRVRFFASDTSRKALIISKKNARTHKVKIAFKQGSLLEPWNNQSFDIIIANLPYLAKQTDPSTEYEPKNALIAKKKGLALYEMLFKQLYNLQPTPYNLFLEIGHDQASAIKKLAKKFLPAFETKIYKDLFKRDRYAILS